MGARGRPAGSGKAREAEREMRDSTSKKDTLYQASRRRGGSRWAVGPRCLAARWRGVLLACLVAHAAPSRAVEEVEVVVLFKDKAVVMVDGTRRFLERGVPSPEGVVLISSDSSQAVLEVDGEQGTWKLNQRISTHFNKPIAPAHTRILPDTQGMYTVTGHINGSAVPLVVDTGATLVAMNGLHAKRLGIDYRLEGEKSVAETASGIVDTYVVELDSVRVGDIELRNVLGSVHEGEFPSIILLGMSFLGQLSMQRDGPVLELRKRP